ncbi:F-box/kelch-repeat protein At2g44130-like [Malania oleifera]|uniref:F-box/kelch-repeat protein At2g44130-like n=1 Tax=Malania oleifera TaxID=397392 RepID=UPI0025AE3773|nr:F-box/kelch-repeat protein At2g44130-like [Malania oleifera]
MEAADAELLPGLPPELALECLTRLPHTAHRVASRVCRRWRELFRSQDFYSHRKKWGYTHKVACLVQSLPAISGGGAGARKKSRSPAYGISVFYPASGSWVRLGPVLEYPNGLPLFCQVCGSEGKLVVMGGWDPASYEPVTDVFVYDFTTGQWRRGRDMPSKRSFFAAGAGGDGVVYVAGGHDESKNALSSAWAYDLGRDEWRELTRMSRERDECEGVVAGDEFWVVSGYGSDMQGGFEGCAEAYEVGTGRWRRVEGAWKAGRCPRGCVGVGKGGELVEWGGLEALVRVGTCGVRMGNRVLLTGSEYEGGPQGFFLAEMGEGENGKLDRVDVPSEFSGFAQSGCCVEI